ncbi:MAG: hypothetical protein RIQ60_3598 [Pseudomonadota bacterium]
MKSYAALALTLCAVAPALAGGNIGVSIGVSQPGLSGRIDIGNPPAPVVVYAQPPVIYAPPVVYAQPRPVVVYQEPVYLDVPPAYRQDWGHHCRRYNACGLPVVFVQPDAWASVRVRPEIVGESGFGRGGDGRDGSWRRHGRHGDD